MSSATSIKRRPGVETRQREVAPKTGDADKSIDPGFHVWHFFILLSLIAATVAVMMARQNTPEHLILISVTIGAAGAAAYAFYKTIAPLAFRDAAQSAEPIGDRLRADLEREKALVLRSIKELEFDRAMGKLSAQDFDEMAGRLRLRALGIMKQLDGGGYRAIIERDLAARMRGTSRPDLPAFAKAPAAEQVGRAPSEQPAVHEQQPSAPERSVGICACGVQNDQDARFCKACGTKLEAA